jgi:hypothetical protein
MLHLNLSTRPFYNVRAVRFTIAALFVIVLLLTVFNVVRGITLSSAQATLGAHAFDAEREAARLRTEAGVIRSRINANEVEVVASAAREANGIIDRRAFSWSELFSQFEATLPPDVRITSVQPQLERDGTFSVSIRAEARRVEDLDAFLEALETQSTFRNVLSAQEQMTDDGLIESTVVGVYEPRQRDAQPAGARR